MSRPHNRYTIQAHLVQAENAAAALALGACETKQAGCKCYPCGIAPALMTTLAETKRILYAIEREARDHRDAYIDGI